jgi:hypothetical protein
MLVYRNITLSKVAVLSVPCKHEVVLHAEYGSDMTLAELVVLLKGYLNILKLTGYVMNQQVCTFCPQFMCFVFISEQKTTSVPSNIKFLVVVTEMKSVYCVVRTGSLHKAARSSSLKG